MCVALMGSVRIRMYVLVMKDIRDQIALYPFAIIEQKMTLLFVQIKELVLDLTSVSAMLDSMEQSVRKR